jgi:hypothetical protein
MVIYSPEKDKEGWARGSHAGWCPAAAHSAPRITSTACRKVGPSMRIATLLSTSLTE